MAKDEPPAKVTKLADARFKSARGKRRPPTHAGEIYERIDYGRDGARASLYNVALVLNEHPLWEGVFAFDEFAGQIVKTRDTPYGGVRGPVNDHDLAEVAAWLSDPSHLGANVRSPLVAEALEIVAGRRRFHPVRDYLTSVVWDGTPRLARLLSDWAGAEHNDYTARVGTMVCVSAVARIFRPGCRVNFMLVLEGEQQIGKSDFVRQLFGEQWFAEALESPSHKDFYQGLVGRWGIEIAEMQSFSRADVPKVKQAITAASDWYRPSYGRVAREFPRQCVFVGTTNESEYLRDATGAARFLPVRVTSIEVEGLIAARDQLWAEAVQRYRDGERYWVLPAQAVDEQEARYQVDSWEEPIVAWLDGKAATQNYPEWITGPIDEVTTTDLMRYALGIDIARHTRQDQMRCGAILRRIGWRRGEAEGPNGAKRVKVYRRPKQ